MYGIYFFNLSLWLMYVLVPLNSIVYMLYSNAIKFTHEGKVGVKLYVIPEPSWVKEDGVQQNSKTENGVNEDKPSSQTNNNREGYHAHSDCPYQNHSHNDEAKNPIDQPDIPETTAWIRCDIKDTGIGIPGML